jgi:hypothetical protein
MIARCLEEPLVLALPLVLSRSFLYLLHNNIFCGHLDGPQCEATILADSAALSPSRVLR